MTAAEWQASTDPQKMLDFLKGTASERKLRLFACACVGHISDLCYPHSRRYPLVALGERFADDRIGVGAFRAARGRFGAMGGVSSGWAVNCGGWAILKEDAWDAAKGAIGAAGWFFPLYADEQRQKESGVWPDRLPQLEDNADREARFKHLTVILCDIFGNPFCPVALEPACLTPSVTTLAQTIYDARSFHRMSKLADALEAAGCKHAEVLAHCRVQGPHVRGCWVVDPILGKE